MNRGKDRGISTFNNLAHGLIRVQEEILEAQYALLDGDLEHTLQEILDFINYSWNQSTLCNLCQKLKIWEYRTRVETENLLLKS